MGCLACQVVRGSPDSLLLKVLRLLAAVGRLSATRAGLGDVLGGCVESLIAEEVILSISHCPRSFLIGFNGCVDFTFSLFFEREVLTSEQSCEVFYSGGTLSSFFLALCGY